MKLLSFILSALILVQSLSFSFEELSQIDELIEHARFHKAEYGDNFLVFLSKHYGEQKSQHERDHQEEKEDHEQLPFNCQNQLLTSVVFFVQGNPVTVSSSVFKTNEESLFYYISPISDYLKKGLLQPPRSA
ncbi:MAG: hypothetical protein HKO90_02175 [Flavobacteriaceae bacterium]|nr:hypothetical protein [Bacteroidia bacterium]NNK87067.1 hypothetical protein [Flavobacteriaceae bacterium]